MLCDVSALSRGGGWLSLQELTSEAASSGSSALRDHVQFAEQLWDQTAAILQRVALGLESTEQLTDFFKGRKKAEEDSAKQMRMMCMVSATGAPRPASRLASCTTDTTAGARSRRPLASCMSEGSSGAWR